MYEIQEAKLHGGGQLIVYTLYEDDIEIISDAFMRGGRIVNSTKLSDDCYRIQYTPGAMRLYLCGDLDLRKEGVISYVENSQFIINYDPKDKKEAVRSLMFLLWNIGLCGWPDRHDILKAIDGNAHYFFVIGNDEKDIVDKFEQFIKYIKFYDHLKLEKIILYMSGSLLSVCDMLVDMCVNLAFDGNEEKRFGDDYTYQIMHDETEKGLMISAFVHYA